MQRHRHPLGGGRAAAQQHGTAHVEEQHGAAHGGLLRPVNLEVPWTDGDRQARSGARHGVEERSIDVHGERIAELVGLGLVGALPARTGMRERVATQ